MQDLSTLNKLLLDELEVLNYILNQEFDKNPYKEVDKIKSIVKNKNYGHYDSINKKIKDINMSIYNRRLERFESISFHLSLIDNLLMKIIKQI